MGTSEAVVTQTRCGVAGTQKSRTVALEFVSAFGTAADAPPLGLTLERPLTDQAVAPEVILEAPGTAEGFAGVIGRPLELRAATRVATAAARPGDLRHRR